MRLHWDRHYVGEAGNSASRPVNPALCSRILCDSLWPVEGRFLSVGAFLGTLIIAFTRRWRSTAKPLNSSLPSGRIRSSVLIAAFAFFAISLISGAVFLATEKGSCDSSRPIFERQDQYVLSAKGFDAVVSRDHYLVVGVSSFGAWHSFGIFLVLYETYLSFGGRRDNRS